MAHVFLIFLDSAYATPQIRCPPNLPPSLKTPHTPLLLFNPNFAQSLLPSFVIYRIDMSNQTLPFLAYNSLIIKRTIGPDQYALHIRSTKV